MTIVTTYCLDREHCNSTNPLMGGTLGLHHSGKSYTGQILSLTTHCIRFLKYPISKDHNTRTYASVPQRSRHGWMHYGTSIWSDPGRHLACEEDCNILHCSELADLGYEVSHNRPAPACIVTCLRISNSEQGRDGVNDYEISI